MNDSIKLDEVDLRILDQLQQDASLSNLDLARTTHTSAATCLRRVKRLRELGVIERQVAVLSPQKMGAGLTAIAEVALDRQGAEHLDAFEARALGRPEVQQCYRVSPGPDFVLVLQVHDMAAWHVLVQQLFTQDANVRNVKTYFSVHRAKFETRIALPSAS